jgi:hypothetical protein
MSRTLNGNLTGKAAQIDAYDRRQAQEEATHQARAKRVNDVCQQIRNILTKKEYDAWWESTSVHGFGKQAEEKLAALKNDAMAACPSAWLEGDPQHDPDCQIALSAAVATRIEWDETSNEYKQYARLASASESDNLYGTGMGR